ncbi:MAG: hypothetical protein ACI83B_000087 [Sediminicola sp.]|jgi:hypothetical protein
MRIGVRIIKNVYTESKTIQLRQFAVNQLNVKVYLDF